MDLVGKQYTFEDGDNIQVTQIKERDEKKLWVTYHIQQGPGIPRKLVMELHEFVDTYGHLFNVTLDDIPPYIPQDLE